ncbi:MAG TPA: hypothetical protein VK158_02620 [Acidobacteriota bacterium]|nr:hypothetical protein [Acidobacteriota bacterium]
MTSEQLTYRISGEYDNHVFPGSPIVRFDVLKASFSPKTVFSGDMRDGRSRGSVPFVGLYDNTVAMPYLLLLQKPSIECNDGLLLYLMEEKPCVQDDLYFMKGTAFRVPAQINNTLSLHDSAKLDDLIMNATPGRTNAGLQLVGDATARLKGR